MTGSSFFLGKVTALGVLHCFVCLLDLACFFLPSFLSVINPRAHAQRELL